MALRFEDITFKVEPPKLPDSISMASVRGAGLEDRALALELLGRRLELGTLRRVETPHGLALASERGEVEFFAASGAVWGRIAEDENAENEERRWRGLKESGRGRSRRFILEAERAQSLMTEARSLLGEAGLLRKEVDDIDVVLDQVTELSEEGEEVRRAAGAATVRMRYAFEGLPVLGAGAKTLTFAEPTGERVRITGLFHVWREVTDARSLKLPDFEGALATAFLKDPEFNHYHERGYRIEVSRIRFGYMALPAFILQGYLFPVLQTEGKVRSAKQRGDYFEFGRYHHVLGAKQYARAGFHASYLGH